MRQIQLLAAFQGDGCAEHATGMLEHEVYLFGGDLLSGDDQVAFVLAVFVIDNDHELASSEVLNGFLYGVQFRLFCHVLYLIYIYRVIFVSYLSASSTAFGMIRSLVWRMVRRSL